VTLQLDKQVRSIKRLKTLKVRLNQKSKLSILISRGNIFSKDLTDILKEPVARKEMFFYTEYLTTLIAYVPRYFN
jgi:hypothetical protein